MIRCRWKTGVKNIINMTALFVMVKRMPVRPRCRTFYMMQKVANLIRILGKRSIKYFGTIGNTSFNG